MVEFILAIPINIKVNRLAGLFIKMPVIELYIDEPEFEFISWGDPIFSNDFKKKLEKDPDPGVVINNVFGHYYYVILDKRNCEIYIGNSMFSILPVYYYQGTDRIYFAENAIKLGMHLNLKRISYRFILETILFNYPLFNHSVFEKISQLPSNSFGKVSGTSFLILKHTRIEELFVSLPASWKKSLNDLSEIFVERAGQYFPGEHYFNSLTAGFDSRTLVSTGLFLKKEFSCYCFGSVNSKDIRIASYLASRSEIPFVQLPLNNRYIADYSMDYGKEFIYNSSGNATFTRAHYLYAAKILSEKCKIVITGDFGSEIFRAVHLTGQVISPNLYALFLNENPEAGLSKIEKSNEFQYLSEKVLLNAWGELKQDLLTLPCYNKAYSGLSKNQKFYVFVFEEVFRKYFGSELINQFISIKNRTPFLDIEFLKQVFKYKLAGIHSDFFDQNPVSRYKGQLLYAYILQKTYPLFGNIITDKGYKPADLLSMPGKMNLIKGYLRKKIRKDYDLDPYNVKEAWGFNKNSWLGISMDPEFFAEGIQNSEISLELLFRILSLSYITESHR